MYNASLTDYKFCILMKAFEEKSKSIQFKIAEDHTNLDINEWHTQPHC